ncbi:hypothetical protein GGR42_001630 [Saonia flava]|uniref:Uncharacterized protein n=1 Tax=Saonia flava TaxID=523696 RepID=A0A846QSX9_9FLAO|nr:hypothetical protein [Saonia flava]NJB71168.1 hypothetical protein [Saonia flava]
MAKEKLEVIKEADLTNNCPECFNQDIKLSFYQKHRYTKFYHKVTGEVSNQIKCNKCSSVIYPVKWTEDIERSFDYYQKMVEPKKKSVQYTTLFYILILLVISLIVAGVYAYLEGLI